MTIASTTSKVSYNGAGSVGPFPITFRFAKNVDIVATHVSTAGVESTLALTTHYTLTGAGDPAGGALTLVSALASGEKLIIKRSPAIVQETDYVENAAFPAESHEAALDLLTMIAQDHAEKLARSVQVPISSTTLPEDYLAEIEADVASAAASAATATTQAGLATTNGAAQVSLAAAQVGLATTQAGNAASSAGEASDSAALAAEWATNPEDDAVTGYPGEYSALHWAAKAAAAASGGAFKVSADDTTPGYLEGKLALISNSGLVFATTSPGGNEVRTLGVDLASNAGLSLGATGLTVDLGTDPGLEITADGLEVKVKSGGGITKDADGLSVGTASGLPTDYLVGLDVAPAADAAHDITLSPGKARSYADTADITLASALTKQIDAPWAAGTNAGGLDTAATLTRATSHRESVGTSKRLFFDSDPLGVSGFAVGMSLVVPADIGGTGFNGTVTITAIGDTTTGYSKCIFYTGSTSTEGKTAIVKDVTSTSLQGNMTYFEWLIKKDSDGTADALFSLSATAPTMPAGYTEKALVGLLVTDQDANIRSSALAGFSPTAQKKILITPTVNLPSNVCWVSPKTARYNIRVIGGGAGGGNGTGTGGGGAGGEGLKAYAGTVGTPVLLTLSGSTPAVAVAGATTSWGAIVTAPGGSPGGVTGGAAYGGLGGVPTGGDINIPGQSGGNGEGSGTWAGLGGNGTMGVSGTVAAPNAIGYGAGGAGNGTGSLGIIIVEVP